MSFLREQIEHFVKSKSSSLNNFYLAPWAMESSWGSTSQMNMFMRSLVDLNKFKEKNKWNWDFVINLSESDFPLK